MKCFSLEEMLAVLKDQHSADVAIESWTVKPKGIVIEFKVKDWNRVAFFQGSCATGFCLDWNMIC